MFCESLKQLHELMSGLRGKELRLRVEFFVLNLVIVAFSLALLSWQGGVIHAVSHPPCCHTQ